MPGTDQWNNYQYVEQKKRNPKTTEPTGGSDINMDEFIQKWLNYEYPQEELNKQLNVFGRQMTAREQSQQRAFQQDFAAQSGGRMSGSRGIAEIGGQTSLASAIGSASIMKYFLDMQNQKQRDALNAYIAKYGIDKNAEIAMEKLAAMQEMQQQQLIGDIGQSIGFLPGLFSGNIFGDIFG